ncbi:Isochorismatase [hydrothermal vent metagenome]|uniref:Isochorismatase n=1 Tax=hydrothermal vent metagenome TaxID=652676 RepID=A0A3B1AQM6_9ZZZZ
MSDSSNKTINDRLSNAAQSQLLIIDVQQKLIPSVPAKVINSVIKNINALQDSALLLNIPTPITEQYPKGLGATSKTILDKYQSNIPITEKTSFSCCSAAEFSTNINQQREQFILVGMESHVCVLQTALALISHKKTVFVVEDAICSRFKKHHHNALARMSNEGVIITNSESVMFEWLQDASHPHFKAVSKLIR